MLTKHIRIPVMLSLLSLVLASCGPAPGSTGTAKSEIRGTIQRAPGQPLGEARVLLLRLDGNTEQEAANLRAGSNGSFSFPNLAAGNYRVRFAQSADQQNGAQLRYRPEQDPRTAEYFAQLTSQSVSFDGMQASSVELKPLVVGWQPKLAPQEGSVSTNSFMHFDWEPVSGARAYAIELLKPDGSLFYRSPEQAEVGFTLKQFTGNQGANNGQALKGNTLHYRVRAYFPASNPAGADYGISTQTPLKFD